MVMAITGRKGHQEKVVVEDPGKRSAIPAPQAAETVGVGPEEVLI
jgi:hypothetical protein